MEGLKDSGDWKAKLCTFWACVWHPNFTGECLFSFPLKSDKSAKQYKLGQVLSWLLIYIWKTSHQFSFYRQFTCEALDFSQQGRRGFWNSSTPSQWICSKFKDDHWEQERLRNLDIELCCFASTQHLEPILTLAVNHLQACSSQKSSSSRLWNPWEGSKVQTVIWRCRCMF